MWSEERARAKSWWEERWAQGSCRRVATQTERRRVRMPRARTPSARSCPAPSTTCRPGPVDPLHRHSCRGRPPRARGRWRQPERSSRPPSSAASAAILAARQARLFVRPAARSETRSGDRAMALAPRGRPPAGTATPLSAGRRPGTAPRPPRRRAGAPMPPPGGAGRRPGLPRTPGSRCDRAEPGVRRGSGRARPTRTGRRSGRQRAHHDRSRIVPPPGPPASARYPSSVPSQVWTVVSWRRGGPWGPCHWPGWRALAHCILY